VHLHVSAGVILISHHNQRDRPTHDKRRRVAWERAFTAKALRAYDPTITLHADELVSGIKTHAGKAVNVSKWFNYFTADTISALGFGEPFHMLKDGKDHWTVTLLQEGSSHLATLGPLPWLLGILVRHPTMAHPILFSRLRTL
jgi:cytochrome P450